MAGNNLIILLLIASLVWKFTPIWTGRRPFELFALWFFLYPFFAAIPAAIVHDQSLLQGMYGLKLNAFWLLYWYLHSRDFSMSALWKAVLVMGVGWSAITIFQQFSASPLFYSRIDTEGDSPFEMRSGVARFLIEGEGFGILTLFFALQRSLDKSLHGMIRLAWMALFTFQILGVLFFATRQVLGVGLVCLLIQGILSRKSVGWRAGIVFSVVLASIAAWPLINASLGDVIQGTRSDLSESNVRYEAMNYFIFEHWKSPLLWLVGNGRAIAGTSYGDFMNSLAQTRGLWQVDIGIFGEFSQFGLVHVAVIIALFVKSLRYLKIQNQLALGVMFLYLFIRLPLNCTLTMSAWIPFMCVIFYFGDRMSMGSAKYV